jgi:hypothetical protein
MGICHPGSKNVYHSNKQTDQKELLLMKKRDLKKLALLGITGGIMLGSSSVMANEAQSGMLIAHNGCGGNGCSGSQPQSQGPRGNNPNYRTSNSCGAPSQNGPNQGNRTANSCGAPSQNPNQPRTASSCGAPTPSEGTRGNGCNSYFRNARNSNKTNEIAQADEQVTNPGKLTESDLLQQLDSQGKATYNGLDAEGKALALKLANQGCKGQNDCKGLNSCKTADNSCAGKGGCKGKSNCAFKDKNKAVKVAAQKQAEKRANLSK